MIRSLLAAVAAAALLGTLRAQDAAPIEQDRDVAEQSRFRKIVRDLEHGKTRLAMQRA